MTQVNTIDLKGKAYAQVKDRLKEFRTSCPNGLIETKPEILGDGQILFKARILKDKTEESSAEATGHALGSNKGAKDFEKLETIAVGRALALLGYATDGEVASGEEMEEFYEYQNDKREKKVTTWEKKINSAKTTDELKAIWSSIEGALKVELNDIKEAKKKKLNESK